MKQHKSEEQIEALDLMRKKVNSELLCLKEKTKEELNLWSGLTTKFVMIKAFSDHLSNTVELIEKQSLEAERSKSLLEGTMSEQLIFLSKATLQISDFSADLSYSEHERALCTLHHEKLRGELKDLEKCLAQAVSEATNMANYKEMIEGQLIAAKETYDRDEAILLQIQESLLSNTKEAEHQLQPEQPVSERSSTTVEKLSFQVAELQAIRMSLQSQVQEHTGYATYLEHCFACRQEVTEDKLDALQSVLQATQRKAVEASLQIQNLNQVISSLKEQDDESAALVANLKQQLDEAKETLHKQIEEIAQRKTLEAIEVQNLNELIRTLKEQNDESSVLVENLRQEVAETKDTLNKQTEEAAQQKAADAIEAQNVNELIRTLKEQNEESSVLVASLRQEVAEAKDTLDKQTEESAQQKAGDAVEAQNLNELIRTLKEQNEESSVLVASLRQEVAEAKDTLNKQIEESAQQKAGDAVEAQNLNELIRILKEQNDESAALVAIWKQEVAEAKYTLNKQGEETAQRNSKDALEIQKLYEVIKTLKEQNNESAALVANLRQEVDEAQDTLKKEIEGSIQRKAEDTLEIQNLEAQIMTLKEQNANGSALVASLRQEVAEAKDTLNKQVEEMTQRKAADAMEVQNLHGVIRTLEEQNDESSALVSRLRQEFTEAKHTVNKQVEEMAQRKAVVAVEVHNLNEVIKTLKEQNDESTALVVHLRQEVAEAKHTLNKQVEDRAQRKALETGEVQYLSEMIMTLKEQNHESFALVANLRQEVVETKGTLNKQVEEMAHQKAREATDVKNFMEVIKTLTEQNDQSSALVVSLRHEVAEAEDTLNKQIEETAQRKAVESGEVQHLNEVIRALKKQNDESAAVLANLRQEVAEAKDTLDKQIEESVQQKAGDAVEAQNLNELIRILKEQNEESTAEVAKLTQEVAKTMKNITDHPDETEIEFCRSLVDHAHRVFEDFSDFKSWYASDFPQQESDVNIVENNPLRDLIISFRGQDLPNLKTLGEHLKHAKVASVSAYNKLIGDCLQEKQNLKDEILNLQKRNEQLCHQLATVEKSVVDLKIQSESDLRAKEDALTRNLKKISQPNEQKILEMKRHYELNRKEIVSSETPKAQQETQFIKVHLNNSLDEDMKNATSNYTAQNVTNTGMSRQTLRHVSDSCMEGSALNGLQSTQKTQETKTKGSNEPQLKRLKSSQLTNSAGGDGIDVVAIKKERRKFSVKAVDTSNGRQTFDRRCKDKNFMVEEHHPKPERLPIPKRTRSSNINSKPGSQQSRAKVLPSSDLGDLFDDSVLDPYEDQEADPYAFV